MMEDRGNTALHSHSITHSAQKLQWSANDGRLWWGGIKRCGGKMALDRQVPGRPGNLTWNPTKSDHPHQSE
jgi:hypothetical protein